MPSLQPDKSFMKTLHQQEQKPVNTAMSQGTTTMPESPALEDFTVDELAMAEILMGLSKSDTSTGESRELAMAEVLAGLSKSNTYTSERGASEAFVTFGSSSPRSVNTQPPAHELVLSFNPGASGHGVHEEEKQEVSGIQRKPKHYRSIAEIYNATDRFMRYNLRNKKE